VAQIEERIQQDEIKMITDPPDLYLFLATSVIEVMNLLFASVDVSVGELTFHREGNDP
jgi:hypothetical protein